MAAALKAEFAAVMEKLAQLEAKLDALTALTDDSRQATTTQVGDLRETVKTLTRRVAVVDRAVQGAPQAATQGAPKARAPKAAAASTAAPTKFHSNTRNWFIALASTCPEFRTKYGLDAAGWGVYLDAAAAANTKGNATPDKLAKSAADAAYKAQYQGKTKENVERFALLKKDFVAAKEAAAAAEAPPPLQPDEGKAEEPEPDAA